ncbi:MAG: ABC transporter ATP-binding protein [Rubrivivax sp.]|nr:ABC transporter ATP-binding protein [Rubrivivax sp.]
MHANRAVNLTVAAGSVHGIVGENGAGKSTLMSILYGFYQADSGRIFVDGRELRIRDSHDAIAAGIGMVHQHFMLVDSLSALDNVMLGAEPGWRLTPARAQVRGQLQTLMQETGLQVRLDLNVEDLPVGERQRLEILKALYRGARILILDEPTAVLTPQETDQLFVTLRGLKARGTTILLITHKLREIMALCDAVTVMRAGAVVLDCAIADTSVDALAQAMVGRKVNLGRDGHRAQPGECLLQVQGLGWRDALGVPRLAEVSLRLHAGEIVGIAGVSGNGQGELLDALSGLLVPDVGTLTLCGRSFAPPRWIDPSQARALRLAHVPEDRHLRGLVLPFAAWESAALGYQKIARYRRPPFMNGQAVRDDTAQMMERYDVRPRAPQLRSSKFSGGNQQKLVLAREAVHEPRVLLVGQPTRGVDIGAIEFIHGRLRALRDGGGAVLVVSSELDEVLALADRVIVMNAGRIAGELPIEQCSESALGRLMGGAELSHDPAR